ncbi:MAG: type IX secretion system membrane protein PorP/SprF [Bacteroidetes bacterium]|nr:type IX secretion system membrane protein PorP/SprF [Bacteroidota bacterium]
MKRVTNIWLVLWFSSSSWRLGGAFCALLLLSFGEAGRGFAQQDPQYSQYMFNQLSINPAYAGSKEGLSTALFLRNQWTGIDGSPKTETITIHGPMRKKKAGLGFTVIADQLGPKKSIGALGSYAYRIKIKDGKLYYNTNSMYAGFSATHLYTGRLTSVDNLNGADSQLAPHLFFTGGKALVISKKLIFSPSCMIKVVKGSPVTADLNFSFLLENRLWVGLSLRSKYGIVAYTQFNITDKFKIGYAFDFGINKIGRASGGSHEIMLSYDFKISKPNFFSPRYF